MPTTIERKAGDYLFRVVVYNSLQVRGEMVPEDETVQAVFDDEFARVKKAAKAIHVGVQIGVPHRYVASQVAKRFGYKVVGTEQVDYVESDKELWF